MNTKKRYMTKAMALSAGLALILAACGGGDEGGGSGGSGDCDVTMTFWHTSTTGEGRQYSQTTAAALKEQTDGVTIYSQTIQKDDIDGNLQTALSSGDASDVFMARARPKLADVVNAG